MKVGTLITFELIITQYLEKEYIMDLETQRSVELSSIKTAIYNTGIELYEVGDSREISFTNNKYRKEKLQSYDECEQIRQKISLVTTKSLSKDGIFKIINTYKPTPLSFRNGVIKL